MTANARHCSTRYDGGRFY